MQATLQNGQSRYHTFVFLIDLCSTEDDEDAAKVNGRWVDGNYIVTAVPGQLLAYNIDEQTTTRIELKGHIHSVNEVLDMQTMQLFPSLNKLSIDVASAVADCKGSLVALSTSKSQVMRFDCRGREMGRIDLCTDCHFQTPQLLDDGNGNIFVLSLVRKYHREASRIGGQIWRCDFKEGKVVPIVAWCVLPVIHSPRNSRTWQYAGVQRNHLVLYDREAHGKDNYRDWIKEVLLVDLTCSDHVIQTRAEFGCDTGEKMALMWWRDYIVQFRADSITCFFRIDHEVGVYTSIQAPEFGQNVVSAYAVPCLCRRPVEGARELDVDASEVFVWWRLPKSYALYRYDFGNKFDSDKILAAVPSLIFAVAANPSLPMPLRITQRHLAHAAPHVQMMTVYEPLLLLPALANALPCLFAQLLPVIRRYLFHESEKTLRFNRLLLIHSNAEPRQLKDGESRLDCSDDD